MGPLYASRITLVVNRFLKRPYPICRQSPSGRLNVRLRSAYQEPDALNLMIRRIGEDMEPEPQGLAGPPSSTTQQALAINRALWIGHHGILPPRPPAGVAISVLMGLAQTRRGPLICPLQPGRRKCSSVVEGTYEMTVDGQPATVGPGSSSYPAQRVHCFKNIGNTTGGMLEWDATGGQDHYSKQNRTENAPPAGGLHRRGRAMEISKKFDTTSDRTTSEDTRS